MSDKTADLGTREPKASFADKLYASSEPASEPEAKPPVKEEESEPSKPTSEAEESAETAEESEPSDKVEESKKQLTPEERSAKDRSYQEKRLFKHNNRLQREIGETRNENRRLSERLAQLEQQIAAKPESAPGLPAVSNGKEPKSAEIEEHDDITSFRTAQKAERDHWKALVQHAYERGKSEGQSEYQRTLSQRQEQEAGQRVNEAFQKRVASFVKKNSGVDFDGAFDDVKAVVAGKPAGNALRTLLAESELAPAIIVYLSEHDDELEKLGNASSVERAAVMVDRIEARLKIPQQKVTQAGKPPVDLGRGDPKPKELTLAEKLYR